MHRQLLLGSLLVVATGCLGTPLLPYHAARADRAAGAPGVEARGGSFTAGKFRGYDFKLYLPTQAPPAGTLPLVVLLHGCGQTADVFASSTQMNAVADAQGFAVLYPEQSRAAHPRQCWRWFDPDDQVRGSGEPAIIDGMVKEVAARHGVDRNAVYLAGLSAGAAMAAIMAATYPDTFAAVGVASGLEYLAATNETAAWMAMSFGGPDPRPLARRIVESMGANRRVMPVMVFHGGSDYIVKAINADQVVSQWVAVDDQILAASGASLPDKPAETQSGQVPGGHAYTRAFYQDSRGTVQIEKIVVTPMSHAWSGGSPGGSFTDPKGPSASRLFWEFFKARRRG